MPEKSRKETVVVFAGAGASKAVSPENYPTTVEFFDQLPTKITSNELFRQVLAFIKRGLSDDAVVDIEVLLWHLEELSTFLRNASDKNTVLGWFVQGNRLGSAIGLKNQNFGHMQSITGKGLPYIDDLVSAIHQQVFALYGAIPNTEQLNETWLPLLRPMLDAGFRVELVTTNYDVVLEYVIEELERTMEPNIDTGRRGRTLSRLDVSLWEGSPPGFGEKGLLTKLHGSVDWQRGKGVIHAGTPTFAGAHEKHLIIYPGFKGRPTEPEIQAFHGHFRRTLEVAIGVLFIGFAFRDDYINELCEQQFRSNTSARVVVLNPDDSVNVPGVDAQLKRLPEYFNRETAGKAAHLLIF